MSMAQIWPLAALMTTVFGAMIGLVLRSMSAQRAELSAKIEGTHEKIDGSVTGLNEKIDGLRNEMNARLDPLQRMVERLDEDVRDLRKELSNSGGRPQTT